MARILFIIKTLGYSSKENFPAKISFVQKWVVTHKWKQNAV